MKNKRLTIDQFGVFIEKSIQPVDFFRAKLLLSLILLVGFLAINVTAQIKPEDTSSSNVKPCFSPGSENGPGIAEGYSRSTGKFGNQPENGGSGTDNLIRTPLKFISKPQPKYTEKARKNGVQGTVLLKVKFLANGKVGKIRILEGLPNGLSKRAVEAAKKIKFLPEQKGGKSVTVTRKIIYNFTIY